MIARKDVDKWAADRVGATDAVDLLWPFVELVEKIKTDPKRGLYVDENKVFRDLKVELGLPLKEWEKS